MPHDLTDVKNLKQSVIAESRMEATGAGEMGNKMPVVKGSKVSAMQEDSVLESYCTA